MEQWIAMLWNDLGFGCRRLWRQPGFTLVALLAPAFGVSATDPACFVGAPIALASAALLACYPPARRAARIDPAITLRTD